ncbi:hypothetical protein PXO_02494 [Xanthomonas oryzae pv. oryzae PXO99A]|uniref:Uncharacterized protein n=1 Tax=Xanthomonas oryzae pv. oryzae (strain PXO99A) TaxID=360094 RepID=A0A0K0GPB9_XANOP|nr:hypothetical protein PXO_02494 [Xanthomonas oryzae pv. oryzae PXO99A]
MAHGIDHQDGVCAWLPRNCSAGDAARAGRDHCAALDAY